MTRLRAGVMAECCALGLAREEEEIHNFMTDLQKILCDALIGLPTRYGRAA